MDANIAMIFEAFSSSTAASSAGQMDGRQFSKMAKDSKLLGKKITSTDVDIIFAKVKAKTSRKITKAQFTEALTLLAEKKCKSLDSFVDSIVEAGGPKFYGTRADNVALHDDKDSYTGVYKAGGPSTVDGIRTADLKGMVDRTDGLKPNERVAGVNPPSSEKKSPKSKVVAKVVAKSHAAGTLKEVFDGFTNGGIDMDNRQLAKFAKDCKILDKKLTMTDIDIDFSKVKVKGERKISYFEFEKLVGMWATKKGLSKGTFIADILARGGPSFTGTKTTKTRLHDDKSGYTGVYAKGGPSTAGSGRSDDLGRINDLSQLADRSVANVRGVKR